MKQLNIAINGFGRIGRNLCRLLNKHPFVKIVAINDLADTKTLAHLLKYDSIHGVSEADITYSSNHITIDKHQITLLNCAKIEDLDWKPFNIDYVFDLKDP